MTTVFSNTYITMLELSFLTGGLLVISSLLLAIFVQEGFKTPINDNMGALAYAQSSSILIGSNHGLPVNQVKGILSGSNIYSAMAELEQKGTINITGLPQTSNTSVPLSEQKLRVIPNPSMVSPEELAKLKEKAAEPHANTAPTGTINPSSINSTASNKSNTVNCK
jgi:hypothetical protein